MQREKYLFKHESLLQKQDKCRSLLADVLLLHKNVIEVIGPDPMKREIRISPSRKNHPGRVAIRDFNVFVNKDTFEDGVYKALSHLYGQLKRCSRTKSWDKAECSPSKVWDSEDAPRSDLTQDMLRNMSRAAYDAARQLYGFSADDSTSEVHHLEVFEMALHSAYMKDVDHAT